MVKQKIEKTNAARLLDRAKISYELIPYEVDENNLAATHVAEQLGEDIATVFKTLILCGDRAGHRPTPCDDYRDHRSTKYGQPKRRVATVGAGLRRAGIFWRARCFQQRIRFPEAPYH
mgnify:CR=1 FL=1